VTGGLDKQAKVDMKAVGEQMLHDLDQNTGSDFNSAPALPGRQRRGPGQPGSGQWQRPAGRRRRALGPGRRRGPDPMKAIQDAIGK
jgi:hypothetical protein